MARVCRIALRHRVAAGFAILFAGLMSDYAVQVVRRTLPLTPLQLIAHRGGPEYAPENTLTAFQKAMAQGADWLEFDLRMTRDGALVVMHDETVDRTTDGTGAVHDLSLAQIRSLDAGQGERVPIFEEVVALARTQGVKLLPELKSAQRYPGMEEEMLRVLDRANYLDQTVIQSFESEALARLHRLEPRAKFCALYGLWQFNLSAPAGNAQYVCPMAEMVLLKPDLIRQAHAQGRQVFIWFGLSENPFLIRVMRFFGADGLMVDDPLSLKGP